MDQPGRLAGRHVPARPAFSAAGPLAGDARAGTHRAVASPPLGHRRDGDRPRPVVDRPVCADLGERRLRGRHAVCAPGRSRPPAAARPAGEHAQRARLSRRPGAPAGRGRDRRRQRRRGPLRAREFEAYDTHSASPQPAPLQIAPPAAALHARERGARRLSAASAWPASSRSRPTGARPSTTAGSRRPSSAPPPSRSAG